MKFKMEFSSTLHNTQIAQLHSSIIEITGISLNIISFKQDTDNWNYSMIEFEEVLK